MPSVKIARPKARPVRRAPVTAFMPGLGALGVAPPWNDRKRVPPPILTRDARIAVQNVTNGGMWGGYRRPTAPRFPATPPAKRTYTAEEVAAIRKSGRLYGISGVDAIEGLGAVAVGSVKRNVARRVVRRAPVTAFMPGLGIISIPKQLIAVKKAPGVITTTRYMAPPKVTQAPRLTVMASPVQPVRLVPPASGVVRAMQTPADFYDDSSPAVYEDSDAASSSEENMDFGPAQDEYGSATEDTDAALSTEQNDFGGLGGLFDIQIGAGTLAIAAVAAYFLLRKKA